jgi:hypothetical protein
MVDVLLMQALMKAVWSESQVAAIRLALMSNTRYAEGAYFYRAPTRRALACGGPCRRPGPRLWNRKIGEW